MEFSVVQLGEVSTLGDGAHAKVKREEFGIPYLTSKNIKHGYLDLSKIDYISSDNYEKLFSVSDTSIKDLREDDILVGIIGTFGNVYQYKKEDHFGISSSIGIIRANKEKILPEFLYYQIRNKRFTQHVEMYKGGSVQGYTNLPTLKKIPIYLTNVATQRKIVYILQSIEEKINLNKLIIKNLEQFSQTLFKHWFIDFEFPNEQGEPYKSSGGEMVESELGEIPKGWSVCKLDEFVESISNSIKKKEQPLARFLNTSDILNGEIMHKELDEVANMPGQAKKLIQTGDILYSEIRPKNKRHAYINFDSDEYVVSTKLMVLRVNETVYSSKVLYQWLASDTVINQFQQLAEDRSGTFPQITFSTIGHYKFAIPPIDIKDKLFNPLELTLDKRLNLMNENKKLAELRDTLLPKLLSGEIEISDELVVD
ncbi:restriction endonuclease subunit S [Bacillus toyonensis]